MSDRPLDAIDWWIPPAVRSQQDLRARARLLLQAQALAAAFGAWTGAYYFWSGAPALGWSSAAYMLGLVGLALAFRNQVTSFRVAANAALALSWLLIMLTAAVEDRLDGSALAWVGLLSYLATVLLGREATAGWTAASLGGLVGVVLLHEAGITPVWVTSELATSLFRTGTLVVALTLFARRFDLERRRAQDEYERSAQAKSRFLATMSHEVRTPMNGLLGMTEVMLHGALSPEQREQVLTIQRSGRALVSLLTDLLDLSKLEAGKLALESNDFVLAQVVSDVEALFRPLAEARHVALTVTLDPAVPGVLRGDSLRLRQVLSNLVDNAVKFTEQGQVTLAVTPSPQGGVRFLVEDTGIGMSAEILGRVFQPFEQAEVSTARRFGGSGLGLALSQQLVSMMGGELEVDSRPGRGTRFTIDLPLPPGLAALATAPEAAPKPESRPPVLIADDNAVNLLVARRLVEKAGYSVVTASNGKEAVEAVAHGTFALVLMDCDMPEMSGFDATVAIRLLEGPMAWVPVVALTASELPEDLEACRRAGMNDFLSKPVTLAALQRVLQRVEHYRSIMAPAD